MRTLLLIEDDIDVRSVLAALLRRQGWQVLEAETGDAGLDLARKHRPQAILCDLLMPGTNGFRVFSTLRADRTLRHSFLVAMSGRCFEDTRRSALESGADEFLAKPIDPDSLLSLLDNIRAPQEPPRRLDLDLDPTVPTDSTPWLRFWGVRGSTPVPGPDTVHYGGNTACVEVRVDGQLLILDAGTGLRPLGEALSEEFGSRPLRATLLVTHAHWDHVHGFPFFKPVYEASTQLRVMGFETAGEGLASVFARQMDAPYFPLSLAQLPARVEFEELGTMEFFVGDIKVRATFVNHPGVCVGYRLEAPGLSMAYLPDHEPFQRTCLSCNSANAPSEETLNFALGEDERIRRFVEGVDVLILDSQFEAEEYHERVGWGHSSVDDALDLAARAGVKRLFLFHHDPSHTDMRMDQLVKYARERAARISPNLIVEAAREGVKVQFASKATALSRP